MSHVVIIGGGFGGLYAARSLKYAPVQVTLGVQASPLGRILATATGAELDRIGRVMVAPDLSVPGHPDIFVIGDLAHSRNQHGQPLPGVAPVAMQQGHYVAEVIRHRLRGQTPPPFQYHDRGNVAIVGRAEAVADVGGWHFSGLLAWLAWLFIHLIHLVEFENRILVVTQWAWNYFTRNRSARLITGEPPSPPPSSGKDAVSKTQQH